MWNMQHCMAHLLAVSNVEYLQNSASGFKNTDIFGPKTMFLGHLLLGFEDIKNRRRPKDAPRNAAHFTYQALIFQINIDRHNWAVREKNRRFLMW